MNFKKMPFGLKVSFVLFIVLIASDIYAYFLFSGINPNMLESVKVMIGLDVGMESILL